MPRNAVSPTSLPAFVRSGHDVRGAPGWCFAEQAGALAIGEEQVRMSTARDTCSCVSAILLDHSFVALLGGLL